MKALTFSTGPAIWIRGVTRRLGINRFLARWLDGGDYEQAFNRALMNAIRPGDTVWDIGANVGHYTREFAKATGRSGCVVAFEPVSTCFAELQSVCQNFPQVRLLNIAIGARDHVATMALGEDPLGVTHRLSTSNSDLQKTAVVSVRAAHSIIADMPDAVPAVVKIDVEGHEVAVLEGFGDSLGDPRLRTIGVEVHFGVLQRNGDPHAPQRIEKVLRSHEFQVVWTDRSHIVASRENST